MTRRDRTIKNVILLLVISFVFILWILKGGPSIEKIKACIATRLYVGVLCCTALIIIKCFVKIIPTTIVYLVCGCILPSWWAVAFCLLATALIFSVSFVGHKDKAIRLESCNSFLYALLLYCVRIIPFSAAGRFLSKSGARYTPAFFGAITGALPSIILSLSLSKNLPKSPPSLNALTVTALLVLNGIYCSFGTKILK